MILSSAYTCASSLMASLTRRMSCSWLPGMAVHELQAVEHVALLEQRVQIENLADEEAEFGFLARGFAPAAGALAGELDPHADLRAHRIALRVLQDQVNLFEILHHRNDGAAELGGEDHGFDVAVVLEAVAHHDAVRRVLGDGHDGEQLGLGADLQAEAEFLAVAVDLFDHQALLVDLDGKHRGIAVAVVVLRDGGAEGFREMAQTVREDVGEADDHRRVQVARLEPLHHLVQIDLAARVHARPDHHVALVVDRKVALAPGLDLIQIERLLDLPGVTGGQRFGGCVHVRAP